jgi:A/G-specific adenine glycosylase
MSTAWFTRALIPWYREHRRPLPWRDNKDPYRIWLSEVILQQTRVDQGTAYWQRFVERYPTVADLARAPEDEVLRLWQGLGYYSRARNLRTAAQQVVELHGGLFPADHAQLKGLKGVGDYTAAAIGSIAFGLAEPVVDGNVYRVLSRVFGVDTPIDSTAGRVAFRALAGDLLDDRAPGDHNQAVMELGALVCTPKSPKCGDCPLSPKCIAFRTDRIVQLPVKAGRTKVRTRHFNYVHVEEPGVIHLRKRTEKDIWQGLYELPLLESEGALYEQEFAERLARTHGKGWTVLGMEGPVKHILSHQHLQARFWRVRAPKGFEAPSDWERVSLERLNAYALPRLIERYLLPSGDRATGEGMPYLRRSLH